MKLLLTIWILTSAVLCGSAYAQKPAASETDPKTTQAYCLLIQRKVAVQAELEVLLSEYTSDYPTVKKTQFEFDTLRAEMKKMVAVDETKPGKLTAGYGSLILRRVALAADVHSLEEAQGSDWPPLRQKQRELELLDQEIERFMR